ncbi:MAG: TM0996/MTH895 family glutaredoxin-like protein [Desulfobulbaceae bacterium]|nr:TM0996/MTH895 family glutaredoxin-like protein [Desulfobulbaceae bacterium]
MKIQVVGPGCPKCVKLAENVKTAIKELEIDADVEKVSDMLKIMEQGIMLTPGLVIDGKTASSGKALSVEQVKELLGKTDGRKERVEQ